LIGPKEEGKNKKPKNKKKKTKKRRGRRRREKEQQKEKKKKMERTTQSERLVFHVRRRLHPEEQFNNRSLKSVDVIFTRASQWRLLRVIISTSHFVSLDRN